MHTHTARQRTSSKEVLVISTASTHRLLIEHYVKYEYVKQPWFAAMPPELFKIMERALGWHLMITAKL